MLFLGLGTSTSFAQTLKMTIGVPSFFPARTAGLTLSNLHPRGAIVILCVEWHMNYSEMDLARKGPGKVGEKDTVLPLGNFRLVSGSSG